MDVFLKLAYENAILLSCLFSVEATGKNMEFKMRNLYEIQRFDCSQILLFTSSVVQVLTVTNTDAIVAIKRSFL